MEAGGGQEIGILAMSLILSGGTPLGMVKLLVFGAGAFFNIGN